MTDPSLNDLNFGHFGAATYGLENSEWSFGRKPQRKELKSLAQWRTASSAAMQYRTPGLLRPPRGVQQTTRELARDYPHLAPAVEQLPELEIISAAATSSTVVFDATIGTLLSFGSIACQGHSDHRPKRVVATPTGEVGNILQLQILEKERHGWDNGMCLEGPSLIGGEIGYWNEEAAPIRQICFADVEARSTFLAVRLPRRTVLFHPTYVHDRKAVSQSKYFDLPSSTIDPYPIHSITAGDTGGTPHADVSFNPEYQRQMGIVDEQGNWSLWDIDAGYRNDKYNITCSVVGSVVSRTDGESTSSEQSGNVKEDGWARISWVGDANTVVVANRRQICVYNVKAGLTPLKTPSMISERSTDWILDVKRHPSNKKHFFTLTSTRLFLVAVICPNDDPEFSSVEPGAVILVSWTHFRGMEDITLQLCVSTSPEDDCIVIVHSRLNTLVTVYRFEDTAADFVFQTSSSDPTTLSMEGFGASDASHCIAQLHLDSFNYKARGLEDYERGRTYQDHHVQFYRLTAVMSNLSIHQVMLYSQARNRSGNALLVEPTSWVRIIKRARCHDTAQVDDSIAEIAFIEPDGLVEAKEPYLKRPCQPPKPIKRQLLGSLRHVSDFSLLYEALHQTDLLSNADEDANADTVDVSVVVQEAERLLLGETTLEEPPLGTLLEFAGMKITVADVDEASTRLQDALPNEHHQLALNLHNIASGHVLGLSDKAAAGSPTIASLYDAILQNWIAPLPTDIPVRVRQSKERLARRIAAEVILASTQIRRLEEPQPQLDSQSGPSQDSGAALPFTSSQSQTSGPSSSQPSSSLPIFPLRRTGPPTPAFATTDPLSRLSKHLRIEDPQLKPIPSGISHILSHWQPGIDPGTYSWEAAEEALQEDTEVDEARQEKREKAQRRKEKREKKQKRENEMFKATTASQPQMPRSSPGPFFGAGMGLGTSSQMPPTSQIQSQSLIFGDFVGPGVQSQVEPGKHGGRPAIKKKKGKKRVGGF